MDEEILEVHDEEILLEGHHSEYGGMDEETVLEDENGQEEYQYPDVLKKYEILFHEDVTSFESENELIVAYMEIQKTQNEHLISIGIVNMVGIGMLIGAVIISQLMRNKKNG